MRVGLVYDLRDDYRGLGLPEEALAEFDSPETIGELSASLTRLGFQVERIGHVRRLAERLVAGERWDLVFNIAEGLRGRAREAQAPALMEAFDQPYTFSDPLTLSVALDKAVAKRLVREAAIPTAPFRLIESDDDAIACDLGFPLFVKPVAEGTGKGCSNASKVHDGEQLRHAARELIARFGQPVIAEPFLPGREFTVGLTGSGREARVIGVLEILLGAGAEAEVYSLDNKEYCESRVSYRLAEDFVARQAGAIALAAYRTLGCRDAGRLDLRCDAEGRPQFLEANPLAGLHPTHSDLPILAAQAGWTYDRLIGDIMQSAMRRYRLAPPEAWRTQAAQ
ncbi:MAG: D-alanine--D-alanine ligase [Alphaproteobacteria bacterium]|nr:D-alanine--D-alanine ligase [Alphaproteobacteria bacterium]